MFIIICLYAYKYNWSELSHWIKKSIAGLVVNFYYKLHSNHWNKTKIQNTIKQKWQAEEWNKMQSLKFHSKNHKKDEKMKNVNKE